MGPLTELEYYSRKDRYDKQLIEKLEIDKKDIIKMDIKEKCKLLYDFRQNQYQKLIDAVYYRRGWTPNGVPTPKKMKQLGMDNPKMLTMLHDKINEDEKAHLNEWGGTYRKGENPPTSKKYWK
jgi:aldehyde:ferredoxin oxidoreductase